MKPILLSGHERSLTQIVFNKEGDLLFTASKDDTINVWFSSNGERLGTYSGHNGTVWSLAVDSQSKLLLSGSADNTMKLWDIKTGQCLKTWEYPTAVKRVAWSDDDKLALCITEQRSGYQGAIRVYEMSHEGDCKNQPDEPISQFSPIGSKATVAAFAPLGHEIITGHESGKVALFDAKTGEEIESNERAHSGTVTDLQLSPDGTYFVTSSKDKTARIHDTKNLAVIKTFSTETPLNSAVITPLKPYVIVGGGQDARSVTTTSTRSGKFETRFWHRVFEEEVGRVRGHFGPINTIAIHPEGKAFASGGEDGYVRVHWFDESYFRSRPYGDLEPAD
ncbi:translation initiation factor eIF3 subunit [Naganishia albida]|nr:translation initiation factor eIF3 subunit [Naganishia albida]